MSILVPAPVQGLNSSSIQFISILVGGEKGVEVLGFFVRLLFWRVISVFSGGSLGSKYSPSSPKVEPHGTGDITFFIVTSPSLYGYMPGSVMLSSSLSDNQEGSLSLSWSVIANFDLFIFAAAL